MVQFFSVLYFLLKTFCSIIFPIVQNVSAQVCHTAHYDTGREGLKAGLAVLPASLAHRLMQYYLNAFWENSVRYILQLRQMCPPSVSRYSYG